MKNVKYVTSALIVVLVLAVVTLAYKTGTQKAEISRLSANSPFSPETSSYVSDNDPKKDRYFWPSSNRVWDPFAEFQNINKQMSKLMDDILEEGIISRDSIDENSFAIDMDIKEDGNKYIVKLDIPGMDKNDINVEIKDRVLIVSGKRESESEDNEGKAYYRKERSYGSFYRSMLLPSDADENNISVEYDKGVLNLDIPKIKQGTKNKKSVKLEIK